MDVMERVRLLPDIDDMRIWLSEVPGAIQDDARRANAGAQRRAAVPDLDAVLAAGLGAVARAREKGPDVDLDRSELDGLEALILMVGRPALQITDGRFQHPVPPGWDVLETHRPRIEQTLSSVGRINLEGHPMFPWAGTGFVVAPGVIMTNRHVAAAFASASPDGGAWVFQPGVEANIDFNEAPGRDLPDTIAIEGVIGVHGEMDLALLAMGEAVENAPEPLHFADDHPDEPWPRPVYTVGYPAWDPRNDLKAMHQVFGGVYDVKRLQPGMLGDFLPHDRIFRHDCSTLGGNSGSCVIDLESGLVLGLHFRGDYAKHNEAVALSLLEDDPLLRAAGLRFARSRLARLEENLTPH